MAHVIQLPDMHVERIMRDDKREGRVKVALLSDDGFVTQVSVSEDEVKEGAVSFGDRVTLSLSLPDVEV